MNPFDSISSLRIDGNERLSLISVLKGYNDVARIDLLPEHASPAEVKEVLSKAGFHFSNLKISGKANQTAAIVAGLNPNLVSRFKNAHEAGDGPTMRRLAGTFVFPANSNDRLYLKKMRGLIYEAPILMLELLLKPQTV